MADTANSLPALITEGNQAFANLRAFLSGNTVPKADLVATQSALADLQTRFNTETEAHTACKAKLTETEASLTAANGKISTLETQAAADKATIDGLNAKATTVDEAAGRKAAQIAAANGHAVVPVPEKGGATQSTANTLDAAMAEYNAETDPQKKGKIYAEKVKPALYSPKK